MATQTFGFIKGNKIENALRYNLYERTGSPETGDLKFNLIATQELIQPFNIRGGMGTNGNPYELPFEAWSFETGEAIKSDADGYTWEMYPITKETPTGAKYYIRFSGYMNVVTNTSNLTMIPFDGVYYFNSDEPVSFKFVNTLRSEEGDGIYLEFYTKAQQDTVQQVKVFSLDTSHTIESVTPVGVLSCCDADSAFMRTTYIPIDSLTDELNGGCVGYYNQHDDIMNSYKMCFYDANFGFLHGVSYLDIVGSLEGYDASDEVGYLTVAQVKKLAGDEAKYVIFSSWSFYNPDGVVDQVSIGNIYFPLFNFKTADFMPEIDYKRHYLLVEAEGDGLFFLNSPYSNVVTYVHGGVNE